MGEGEGMKGLIGVRQSGEQIALYMPSALRRISWTAVGAGVGIALLIQFMFTVHGHLYQFLIGVGAGMGATDPTRIETLTTGALSRIPGSAGRVLVAAR